MSGDLLQLCGLWLRTSKAGRQYLAGRLGHARVVIMENRDRVTDEDATHVLLLGERTPNTTTDTATASASRGGHDFDNGGTHGTR